MTNFTGAIPLLRKFRDHPFWQEKRKFSRAEAWIDLLFMARFSEKEEKIFDRGEIIIIKYGQILTSIITLSNKWLRSRTWTRNFINFLKENESILIIKMDNRRTIFEIVNMGQVRKLLQQSSQQINQQIDYQKSNKRTYKNNDDKDNKVNKDLIPKGITVSGFGNKNINDLISYLQTRLRLPLLDGSVEINRRYCQLALNKFGGVDKVKLLIDATAQHNFWSTRITSFRQLYNNGVNIISSGRDNKFTVTKI